MKSEHEKKMDRMLEKASEQLRRATLGDYSGVHVVEVKAGDVVRAPDIFRPSDEKDDSGSTGPADKP